MPNSKSVYPTIPENRLDDLAGFERAAESDLIIFMAGNQFMLMAPLLASFRMAHPEVKRICYETLPPGLELKQILAGGARFGRRVLRFMPDVYTSVSSAAVALLGRQKLLKPGSGSVYLHNRLDLMVAAGNPKGIRGPRDLGRAEVRVSQPNPDFEDIALHILEMYRCAGGAALEKRIMQEKQHAGTMLLTTVHHRETPQRILAGISDVGPVWATEIQNALAGGLALESVSVGADCDQRERAAYYVCELTCGRNPLNGQKFAAFLKTAQARAIFNRFGFLTPADETS